MSGQRLVAERHQRRRLSATNHGAQIRGIGRIERLRLPLNDFARAQHFHGHAAGLSLGIREPKQRHGDDPITWTSHIAVDRDARGGRDRLEKRDVQLARAAQCPSRPRAVRIPG